MDNKLHDDRSRDVRHNSHREDGELEKRTTGERVKQTKDITLIRLVLKFQNILY